MIFFLIFVTIAASISLSNKDPAPSGEPRSEYREPNGGNK